MEFLKKIDATLASFDEKYSDQDKFQKEMEQEVKDKEAESNKPLDSLDLIKEKAIEITQKIEEKL